MCLSVHFFEDKVSAFSIFSKTLMTNAVSQEEKANHTSEKHRKQQYTFVLEKTVLFVGKSIALEVI